MTAIVRAKTVSYPKLKYSNTFVRLSQELTIAIRVRCNKGSFAQAKPTQFVILNLLDLIFTPTLMTFAVHFKAKSVVPFGTTPRSSTTFLNT